MLTQPNSLARRKLRRPVMFTHLRFRSGTPSDEQPWCRKTVRTQPPPRSGLGRMQKDSRTNVPAPRSMLPRTGGGGGNDIFSTGRDHVTIKENNGL